MTNTLALDAPRLRIIFNKDRAVAEQGTLSRVGVASGVKLYPVAS